MTIPPVVQGAVITAADVMHQLADISKDVTAARADLAAANTKLAVIDVRTETGAVTAADHEARIRVLESFRSKLLGISIAVSTSSGILSGLIGYLLGHLHLYKSGARRAALPLVLVIPGRVG